MVVFHGAEKILARTGNHFNEPEWCDAVVIAPTGENFHIVKFMLMSASDVFARMLASDMLERSTNEIRVENVDASVLELMLRYMHTGTCEIDETNVIQLKVLADRYNVQDLVEFCKVFEDDQLVIDEQSCTGLLEEALEHGWVSVAKSCMDYMVWNMANVRTTSKFRALEYETMSALTMQAPSASSRSMEGYNQTYTAFVLGLVDWIEHQSDLNEDDKLSLLSILDFECMTLEQLSHVASFNCIRKTPDIWKSIIESLGSHGQGEQRIVCRPSCRKFSERNVLKKVKIPRSSWYFITVQGAATSTTMFGSAVPPRPPSNISSIFGTNSGRSSSTSSPLGGGLFGSQQPNGGYSFGVPTNAGGAFFASTGGSFSQTSSTTAFGTPTNTSQARFGFGFPSPGASIFTPNTGNVGDRSTPGRQPNSSPTNSPQQSSGGSPVRPTNSEAINGAFNSPLESSRGTYVEGCVFLQKGSELHVLLGDSQRLHYNTPASGGGSCVILKENDKMKFLFVAGGGGKYSSDSALRSLMVMLESGELPGTWCDARENEYGGCYGCSYVSSVVEKAVQRESGYCTNEVVIHEGRTTECKLAHLFG